jgi:integrase
MRIKGMDYESTQTTMTSEELTASHLRHMRLAGLAPDTTIYQRRRALARLAATLPVPLIDATADQLYEWRASLAVCDSSARSYTGDVRQFYAWLQAAGHRDDNPAVNLPVPPKPARLPRPIAETDLARALDAAAPRIRLWLILAAWCGLRAKEIALLRVECIRLSDTCPYILVADTATKGRTEHVVPLAPFVIGELRAERLPASGWAFRRYDGQAGPNRPWLVSKLANEHLRSCGLADTLHSLRHRFGTIAYSVDHDLAAVQEMMGHRQITSTRGYAKVAPTRTAAIVSAMPAPQATLRKASLKKGCTKQWESSDGCSQASHVPAGNAHSPKHGSTTSKPAG